MIVVRNCGDHVHIRHAASRTLLTTSRPPAFGGRPDALSSTDLLAAALGSCFALDLDDVLRRAGFPPAAAIHVEKELGASPSRLCGLSLTIESECCESEKLQLLVKRTLAACLVRRSLDRGVAVRVAMMPVGAMYPVAPPEASADQ